MNATLAHGLLLVVVLALGLIVAVLLGGPALHDAMPSLPSVAELMTQ